MAENPRSTYVWMDGGLVAWDDANVHILTHTLHYGLGVFEGTRAYRQADGSTAIFRLEDHVRRLLGSARICNIELPFDYEALRAASLDVVAANRLESCYLRHIAFLDAGTMGLFPRHNPVRVAIAVWPWGAYLGDEGLQRGVRCKIASYARPFPNSTMTRAKITGNYVNSILAKREVVAQGYEEAIMLDVNGYVAECSGENLFLVRNGVVKTPMMTSVLEGITRDSVCRIARDLGHEVVESIVTRDELYVADEVFMTGTAAEVTPVREIDDRPIGDGKAGTVTLAVQARYFEAIRGERPEYADWLTAVPLEPGASSAAV